MNRNTNARLLARSLPPASTRANRTLLIREHQANASQEGGPDEYKGVSKNYAGFFVSTAALALARSLTPITKLLEVAM